MTERYNVWQSSIELQSSYILDHVDDIVGGFYVTILDQHNNKIKIKISFPNSIYAHQLFVDQNIVNYRKAGIGSFNSPFFTVQNSEYLKWLNTQSYDIWKKPHEIHFVIVLKDAIIDIFATEEPSIEVIKQD